MAEKISDYMSTNLVTLDANDTCIAASKKMRDRNIGDVLVVDSRSGQVHGICTDRDIVVRALAEGKDPAMTRLAEVCSKQLVTLGPDDDVNEAIELMRSKAVRRLPVMKNGGAIGIVSLGDLAARKDPKSVLGQVSTAPPNV